MRLFHCCQHDISFDPDSTLDSFAAGTFQAGKARASIETGGHKGGQNTRCRSTPPEPPVRLPFQEERLRSVDHGLGVLPWIEAHRQPLATDSVGWVGGSRGRHKAII